MKYNHNLLTLPIHPGNKIYIIDEGRGWAVREESVSAVCITETELLVITDTAEPGEDGFEKLCFTSKEDAQKWAEENRPDPPYPYWYDAKEWMKTDTWCPAFNGWYYVRVQNGQDYRICKAYYETGDPEYSSESKNPAGFYQNETSNAARLNDVTAWIDSCFDMNYILSAGYYNPET